MGRRMAEESAPSRDTAEMTKFTPQTCNAMGHTGFSETQAHLELLLAASSEMRHPQHMQTQHLKRNLTSEDHSCTYHWSRERGEQGFPLLRDSVVLVKEHSILKGKGQS